MTDRQSEYRGPHTAYEGYYRVKLHRRGVWVAARITFEHGKAVAIVDGQRSVGEVDSWGQDAVDRIALWGQPINAAEHDYLVAFAKHARDYMPNHPAAAPTKPISLRLVDPNTVYQGRKK